MDEEQIGKQVVDAAIAVHRGLGPGLLESVYEVVLLHELKTRGVNGDRQVPIAIEWHGRMFDQGFRADILLENKVILELKSVDAVTNVHKKQLLTYLKLSGIKLGFLINFNEALVKNGITRIVNDL